MNSMLEEDSEFIIKRMEVDHKLQREKLEELQTREKIINEEKEALEREKENLLLEKKKMEEESVVSFDDVISYDEIIELNKIYNKIKCNIKDFEIYKDKVDDIFAKLDQKIETIEKETRKYSNLSLELYTYHENMLNQFKTHVISSIYKFMSLFHIKNNTKTEVIPFGNTKLINELYSNLDMVSDELKKFQ